MGSHRKFKTRFMMEVYGEPNGKLEGPLTIFSYKRVVISGLIIVLFNEYLILCTNSVHSYLRSPLTE